MNKASSGFAARHQCPVCHGPGSTTSPHCPCPAHSPGPHFSPPGPSVPAPEVLQQGWSPAPHSSALPSHGSLEPGPHMGLHPDPSPSPRPCLAILGLCLTPVHLPLGEWFITLKSPVPSCACTSLGCILCPHFGGFCCPPTSLY